MFVVAIKGFTVGLGLIAAIGAQNVFVLTRGVLRNHHFLTASLCAACDLVLIGLGVGGLGQAISASPLLREVAAWGGAAFLSWYGLSSLGRVVRGGAGLEANPDGMRSRRSVAAFTLAVTLLNPHVYVDTVVLLGGIGSGHPPQERAWFGLGAACASVVWFFSLSLCGQVLAPVLGRPGVWRCVQGVVGAGMLCVALSLVV